MGGIATKVFNDNEDCEACIKTGLHKHPLFIAQFSSDWIFFADRNILYRFLKAKIDFEKKKKNLFPREKSFKFSRPRHLLLISPIEPCKQKVKIFYSDNTFLSAHRIYTHNHPPYLKQMEPSTCMICKHFRIYVGHTCEMVYDSWVLPKNLT